MKYLSSLTVALILFSACGPAPPERESIGVELAPNADCFQALATKLSTDEMEGRGPRTEGVFKAAQLIADQYALLGVDDPLDDYRQPFEVIVGVELGEMNTLSAGETALTVGEDFTPLGFSSSGDFSAPLVFAGYGIRAEELGYDDYAGLDVTDKVVLAMRFEPGESDPDSPFDGRKASRFSDLRYKALKARTAGAAALIFVDPPRDDEEPDRLPALKSLGPLAQSGLPVLQVTREVAAGWVASAGHDLADLKKNIDAGYKPYSFEIPELTISGSVDVAPTRTELENVVGIIPGSGALADEIVVVGAHFDHLGYGEDGSMRPGERAIHNGADDNASGVAAMVCALGGLAESNGDEPRRTLMAIAFGAEEMGLGGSGYYVDHPVLPIEDVTAMINLDMVGRLTEDGLSALGTASSSRWEETLEPLAEKHGLKLNTGGDGYGPSDQTSFYEKEIPVVHFFTGAHEQYHTPDDDAELLNAEGGGTVAALLSDLLTDLTRREENLDYIASTTGPTMTGDSRGFGAYLGTIPDYSEMLSGDEAERVGVLLSDVRGGGPADLAGIQGGDRIVEMAGLEILSLYDMTFALREHRPGQTIDVVVYRDGERITLRATLGDRKKMATPVEGDPHG